MQEQFTEVLEQIKRLPYNNLIITQGTQVVIKYSQPLVCLTLAKGWR